MRRTLSFVPLAPVAVACVLLGCDALLRDVLGRSRRWYAELRDEIEGNR